MERVVRVLVAAGLALVAGLWPTAIAPSGSPLWLAGALLALLGALGLAAGIASELQV